MFLELIFHPAKIKVNTALPFAFWTGGQRRRLLHGRIQKTVRGSSFEVAAHERMILSNGTELLLPSALLMTIQAQLFTPFMFINLCLAAFFQ
jgi:hypothetical protein